MELKRINVGGQAVIEGVLIRGPRKYVVAVRKKNRILHKNGNIPTKQNKFLKMPFVRGGINLYEMMVIGVKSLMWSAEQAGEEKEKLGKKEITLTIIFSFGIVILFLILLPYFLTNLVGFFEEERPVIFNLVDGLFRVAVFLTYLLAISKMKEIKRLFQYHGAEHMAIHCYEHGQDLTFKNVGKFKTLHPRCGTSFIILVFFISILVFSILPSIINHYYIEFLHLNHWLRKSILIPIRILLLPFIAGISYEILKLSDRRKDNPFFRIISYPGLALQKITTQKPSEKQIEVAIHSLKNLLKLESNVGNRRFPSTIKTHRVFKK